MNTIAEVIHKLNLTLTAEEKGLEIKWRDSVCTVSKVEDGIKHSYSIALLGNWPKRVEDRINWLATKKVTIES